MRKLIDIFTEKKSIVESEESPTPESKPKEYHVIDGRTGSRVGKPHKSRHTARARVDKLDNEWGGYRYQVKPIYESSDITSLSPSMVITYESNSKTKNLLKGKYSDLDALVRILKNFYNLVLSSEVDGQVPKIIKYSKSSVSAAVKDPQGGEYLIKIMGLNGYDDVKIITSFLKSLSG